MASSDIPSAPSGTTAKEIAMISFFKKSGPHKVSIADTDQTIDASPDRTLLETLLGLGMDMPHDCKVGSCGTCRFRLIEGKVKELSPSALALEKEELDEGYRLACQAMPRSDLTIAANMSGARVQPVESYSARISGMPRLCPDIIGLTLETDRPVVFAPGQYADLSVDAVDGARSYSFAFAPKAGSAQSLLFNIRHVPGGAFTDWLFSTDRVGETVCLSAPYGDFALRDSSAPMLCIAGGSGLAPIISILELQLEQGADRPVTLHYGARTQAHLYNLDVIARLKEAWNAPFEFVPVLSEESDDSDWEGERGLVVDLIDRVPGLSRHEAYLCGPPVMIDIAESRLLACGMDAGAISADRFLDRRHLAQQQSEP